MTDDSGSSLPVLGRYQNAIVAASVMLVLIGANNEIPDFRGLWKDLFDIANGSEVDASKIVETVVEDYSLNESTHDALIDFAGNFFLCAVMNRDAAGTRQVLKYSYHWEQAHSPGFWGPVRSVFTGLGFCSSRYDLEVAESDYSSSYHLEVPAPRGLAVTVLKLGGRDDAVGISEVGHAQTTGESEPLDFAALYLRLTLQSHLPLVALHATLAFIVLGVLHWFPNVLDQAQTNKDSTTTLLLLVPAFLFGLAARRTENFIVSRLLFPLRWISFGLALVFLVLAALLVIGDTETVSVAGYVETSLFMVSVAACILIAGTVVSAIRLRR